MMDSQSANTDQEIVAFLERSFAENYERLKLEEGRGLSPDGRLDAWRQVLLYWRKLSDIARSITDTEVRLTLPDQESPQGRSYAIEGIVDIVREHGHTVMYDIKSVEADHIRQHAATYEKQLNVYAHIWQSLRGEPLQQTAIIATGFPQAVARALEADDEGHLAYALAQWNPVVPLDFDPDRVAETVAEFGDVVDAIADSCFTARPVEHLDSREGLRGDRFATAVCRNCDARFSCASYREWALGSSSHIEQEVRQYLEDYGGDEDLDSWRTANLEVTPQGDELSGDYGR